MSRSARDTLATVPSQAGVPGAVSGRQRKQGRKPAASAAAAAGKKRQFSRFGVGAGHTGLQYTPVLVTPVKKRPSKRPSRLQSAP